MSDPVVSFRDAAVAYCRLVEGEPIDRRAVFSSLAQLVDLGLRLPLAEPTTDQDPKPPPGLGEDVRAVTGNLLREFGESDTYWEVFDPRDQDSPVAGSLMDDLGDIYRDLRRGLHLMDQGLDNDAAWDWRFSFEIHWGLHAVDAMRVLHRLVFD